MRLSALSEMGHEVRLVDSLPPAQPNRIRRFCDRVCNRLGYPRDRAGVNIQIVRHVQPNAYDLLWAESVRDVRAETLIRIKERSPATLLVAFIMDDPFTRYGQRWGRFLRAVPYYDIHFVVRDVSIGELAGIGAKRVCRYHKGFYPAVHRPLRPRPGDPTYDVLFAGHCEPKRESDLEFLLDRGIRVHAAGNRDWEKGKAWNRIRHSFTPGGFLGDAYARALGSAKIALCYYSQRNRDVENSRMYEIPACGAFMLAERNAENVRMFEEGREAEFFSSREELLDKTRYYLEHQQQRERIAAAGRQRCLKSGYDYHSRLKAMLRTACELRKQ